MSGTYQRGRSPGMTAPKPPEQDAFRTADAELTASWMHFDIAKLHSDSSTPIAATGVLGIPAMG